MEKVWPPLTPTIPKLLPSMGGIGWPHWGQEMSEPPVVVM